MLSPKKHPLFALFFPFVDALGVFLGYCVAYWTRFSGLVVEVKDVPDFEHYLRIIAIAIPIYLVMFRSYRLYQPERHVRRIQELFNVFKAVTAATIVVMALTFVYREFTYSRIVLFAAWLATIIICGIGRYFLIQFEYWIRTRKNRSRVLIVGMNRSVRDLIHWTKGNPHYGEDIVGVLARDNTNLGKHFEDISVLGTYLNFENVLEQNKINEVVIADPDIPKELVTDLILMCENKMIGFKLVADFYGLVTHNVDVEYISNVPLIGLKALPLDDPWNRGVKRLFDALVSSALLLVCTPLLLLITILTRLSDKGPIFYKQERIGRDGRRFILYKFRTMAVGAEKQTGPVWAKPDDERTTTVGRFMRRFNLDELPQLWNVLVGEMSLVGPRPERPHFVEQFRDQIPRYMARHKIKSGITGWAQIHGLRGNTSLEERIKYDLYYMENWTLMMDVEILLSTFFAFKNAY